MQEQRRRWSASYRTRGGLRPLDALQGWDIDAHAAVQVACQEVAEASDVDLEAWRCPGTDVYETRASAGSGSYRILFALDPHQPDVLLGLVAVADRPEPEPGQVLRLAQERLAEDSRIG